MFRSDVYTNGVRVNYQNAAGQSENMILVNLATHEALAARVATLEAQLATLVTQQSAIDTAVTAVETQSNSIWAFTQNNILRLTNAGI